MSFGTSAYDSSTSSSVSAEEHREQAPTSVRCAVLTISDTRSKEDDGSGAIIRQNLSWRGHDVVAYEIVPDDASRITTLMREWIERSDVHAIITNGGTGIAGRDNTYEAIVSLLDKNLPGFGEIFRMLSFQEIGAAAMLSRAVAGVANGTAVFSLPGSSNATRLAMEKLIGTEIAHMVLEINK